MKEILVFCHNFIAHNWFPIVSEQLELLHKSELYQNTSKIYYCYYAEEETEAFKFFSLVKKFDKDNKITIVNHSINDCERQTLWFMQEICRNYSDAYLLYYHTKGVSTKARNEDVVQKNVESWRKIMEYFNIEKWENNIEKLQESIDVCGIFYGWWTSASYSGEYFAGNFWWTKSSYFNRLPSMKDRDNRMGCETLVTSIPHVWHNFYQHNIPCSSLYDVYYDPSNYRDNKILKIK